MEELNDYLVSLEASLEGEKERWNGYLKRGNEPMAVRAACSIAMLVREIRKVERSMGFD